MEALRHLSRVSVEIDGRPHELWLQAPTTGFELPLLPRPGEQLDAFQLSVMLAGFMESLDGAPPSQAQRSALAANAASVAALLALRAKLYDDVRLQGRVLLRCPHDAAEAEVDLVTLALTHGTNPWPVAAPDGTPTLPSLSTLWPPGARPAGAVRAAGARLALPSRRLQLDSPWSEAAFGAPLTAERDAEGWRRWAGSDQPFDPARAHWRHANPGFRAILRMALALERLDDARDLEPGMIERLPVTDFLFADAAYHYLYVVPVHDPARASIRCVRCGQPFLAAL